MDAPLLLALAHARLRAGDASVQQVWVGPKALMLGWAPDRRAGWPSGLISVFLLAPAAELWLLHEKDEAFVHLKAQAKGDLSRRWSLELKGARLESVEGDPRERWMAWGFRRRAITGRIEQTRLAFQAIPGRAGLRLDGVDLNSTRIGLGSPFPASPPELPAMDPPPLRRWKERWGEHWQSVLQEGHPDLLPGAGSWFERHHAWSLERAARLLTDPKQAAQERLLHKEAARLARYAAALAQDRARHQTALQLREKAHAVAAELYRFKGTSQAVELLDGTLVTLPVGLTAEHAVQQWFRAIKRAERGLERVALLERECQRQILACGIANPTPSPSPTQPPRSSPMDGTEKKPNAAIRRKDGKGAAFRNLSIDGFDVLIGKGDADNDTLTFKVAAPLDVWMHVAGVPGSHVIIRNPDRLSELPREVLERAAQLAAWHSKARDGGKVEVHVCRVADVSKPRGFPPGKVILRQWKALRVYPRE